MMKTSCMSENIATNLLTNLPLVNKLTDVCYSLQIVYDGKISFSLHIFIRAKIVVTRHQRCNPRPANSSVLDH